MWLSLKLEEEEEEEDARGQNPDGSGAGDGMGLEHSELASVVQPERDRAGLLVHPHKGGGVGGGRARRRGGL